MSASDRASRTGADRFGRVQEAELREDAWDPLSYVYLAAAFSLLARDFAPWQHRGPHSSGEWGSGQLLDGAAAALTGMPGRPVSLLHTQTALTQLSGVTDLIDQGVAEAERRAAEPGRHVRQSRPRAGNDRRAPNARAAVDEFRHPAA